MNFINFHNDIREREILDFRFFYKYSPKFDFRIYVRQFNNIFYGLIQTELNTILYRFSLVFFKIFSILNIFIKFISKNFLLMFKIVSLKLPNQSVFKKNSKDFQFHQNKKKAKILKKQIDIWQLNFQAPKYFLKKKFKENKTGMIMLKFRQMLSHSQLLFINLVSMRSGINIFQYGDYILKKPNNYKGLKKYKICKYLSILKFELLLKIKNFKKNKYGRKIFFQIAKKKTTKIYQSRNIYILIKNFIGKILPLKKNKVSHWKNFFFYKKFMKKNIKKIVEKNLKKSRISIFLNFYFFFLKKNIEVNKKFFKKTGFCFFCFAFFGGYYFNSDELTKKRKKRHSYLLTILYKNKNKRKYFTRANEIFSKMMFENLHFTIRSGYLLKTLYKKTKKLGVNEKCFFHNFFFFGFFSYSSFFVSISTRLDFFFYLQKQKIKKKNDKKKKNCIMIKNFQNLMEYFFIFFYIKILSLN